MKKVSSYPATISAAVLLVTAGKKKVAVAQAPSAVQVPAFDRGNSGPANTYKPGVQGNDQELMDVLPLTNKLHNVKIAVIDNLAMMEGGIIPNLLQLMVQFSIYLAQLFSLGHL